MKICISSSGPTLNSPVDPRFGRSLYFLIIDEKTEKLEAVPNPAQSAWQGAGIAAAQGVINKGVKVLITGNIGPNAFGVLSNSGVKIYSGVFNMNAKQALEMYKSGELQEGIEPNAPGHFGMGPGIGPGMGRRGAGFGRGMGRGFGRGFGGGGRGRFRRRAGQKF